MLSSSNVSGPQKLEPFRALVTSWMNNQDPSEVAHSMALFLVFPGWNSTEGSGLSNNRCVCAPKQFKGKVNDFL